MIKGKMAVIFCRSIRKMFAGSMEKTKKKMSVSKKYGFGYEESVSVRKLHISSKLIRGYCFPIITRLPRYGDFVGLRCKARIWKHGGY